MRFYRWSTILTVVGISGGLSLTLFSGLYTVKPFVIDGDIIYFGFPFAWFEAGRKGLLVIGPWYYHFIWHSFIIDFIIYGLLTVVVIYVYLITITAGRKHSKETLPSLS